MKLVADEGVDKPIVVALRAAGFEVEYFAEVGHGSGDAEVLAEASASDRLLLTCDKDFGELVYRQRRVSAGVVLIRLAGLSAESKSRHVLQAIRERGHEMVSAFTVISPGYLRLRRH